MSGDDSNGLPATPGTLGAVLYSRPGAVVAEREWVALVASVADGDERAFRALYERSHRMVFTLVMRLSNDRQTAEELTIDVFHDVWRRAAKYDPSAGSVVGWIMNQARSRAIDRLRHDLRQKRVDPHAGHEAPAERAGPAEAPLEEDQRARTLRAAVAGLSGDERRAIETAYFSGLSYSEVATRLKTPIGTIKTRIRSGLEKLRDALGSGGNEL